MTSVLITGATGFIGSEILSLLKPHFSDIHATARDIGRITNDDAIEWHEINLLDKSAIQLLFQKTRPEYLLHLAWNVEHREYVRSDQNFQWVEASLELLREFANNGGKRALFAGTCFEYDLSYGYCSEEITPLSPETLYGVCKDATQKMGARFCRDRGISFVWGRIFYLYGPHENPGRLVPMIINGLIHDKPVDLTHGNQIRDYLYSKDVASAFVHILISDTQGPVNIGSGEPVRIKDIANKIGEIVGRPELLSFGSVHPGQIDPGFIVANNSRLREETGWTQKYSLEEGLKRTLEWWINKK